MNRFPAFFFLFLFICASAVCAEKTVFVRSGRPGERIRAELSCRSLREYRFRFSGDQEPRIVRKEERLTLLAGLETLHVNASGVADRLRLRITLLSGEFGGRTYPDRESGLNGRTVTADLSGNPVRFSPLPGEKSLSFRDQLALAMLFHPAEERPPLEVLGPPRVLRKGDSWNCPLLPLQKQFQQRGIPLSEKSISLRTLYSGIRVHQNIRCHVLRICGETRPGQDPDLRLEIRLLLPEDPSLGLVRMERTNKEVLSRRFPEDDPLSAGSSLRVITQDFFSASLLPDGPQKKNSGWSRRIFF